MRSHKALIMMLPVYLLVLGGFVIGGLHFSESVTTLAESAPLTERKCVIVDAGHGGVDGGATSCTGILESKLNLDVAKRVNDLLHLLGVSTKMIRTEDISIYTTGETIAAKKISDLKERVKIVNNTDNGILISIHMNHYSESKYYGPQVFYAQTCDSKEFANTMQLSLKHFLDPNSKRSIKKSDGIYLMEHIETTGILIECGFLSNPQEESKLRNSEYQKTLAAVIAATTASYLHGT